PNAAFVDDPATISDKQLLSPNIGLICDAGAVQVSILGRRFCPQSRLTFSSVFRQTACVETEIDCTLQSNCRILKKIYVRQNRGCWSSSVWLGLCLWIQTTPFSEHSKPPTHPW